MTPKSCGVLNLLVLHHCIMPDLRGNVPKSESDYFRKYVQEVLAWFLPEPFR